MTNYDYGWAARIAAEEAGAERDWSSWDAAIADHEGSYDDYADDDGRTCSICDGLGHGYPGGPPCPLEQTDYSGVPWWAM